MKEVSIYVPVINCGICAGTSPGAWMDYIIDKGLSKDYGFSSEKDCEDWINNHKSLFTEDELGGCVYPQKFTQNEFTALEEAISELRLVRGLVDDYRKVNPHERYGQATFNVLDKIYTPEVERLRSKDHIDPFYHNEYVDRFYSELAKLIKVSKVEVINQFKELFKTQLSKRGQDYSRIVKG